MTESTNNNNNNNENDVRCETFFDCPKCTTVQSHQQSQVCDICQLKFCPLCCVPFMQLCLVCYTVMKDLLIQKQLLLDTEALTITHTAVRPEFYAFKRQHKVLERSPSSESGTRPWDASSKDSKTSPPSPIVPLGNIMWPREPLLGGYKYAESAPEANFACPICNKQILLAYLRTVLLDYSVSGLNIVCENCALSRAKRLPIVPQDITGNHLRYLLCWIGEHCTNGVKAHHDINSSMNGDSETMSVPFIDIPNTTACECCKTTGAHYCTTAYSLRKIIIV